MLADEIHRWNNPCARAAAELRRLHYENERLTALVEAQQPAHQWDTSYPPLPARRRAFLCTKCGGRECEPGTLNETHPTCKCGYMGFAEDLDFTADEMRAYVDADRAARTTADSQPAPVSSDALYLLRRLLSNQRTLTSAEFREELTKIVGEATQAEVL